MSLLMVVNPSNPKVSPRRVHSAKKTVRLSRSEGSAEAGLSVNSSSDRLRRCRQSSKSTSKAVFTKEFTGESVARGKSSPAFSSSQLS